MFQLNAYILGFEHLKVLCEDDEDLGEIHKEWQRHSKGDFLLHDGYLFKGTRLCVPKCGARELLITELYGGSLAGHYGENKTSLVLKEHYYWPTMSKDMYDILKRCATCQIAKSRSFP